MLIACFTVSVTHGLYASCSDEFDTQPSQKETPAYSDTIQALKEILLQSNIEEALLIQNSGRIQNYKKVDPYWLCILPPQEHNAVF